MVFKRKESACSDGDVSKFPLPKILRLLIENPIDKLILHVDIGVDTLRKIGIIEVATLQVHFLSDDLSEPIVVKGKIVDKGFGID